MASFLFYFQIFKSSELFVENFTTEATKCLNSHDSYKQIVYGVGLLQAFAMEDPSHSRIPV